VLSKSKHKFSNGDMTDDKNMSEREKVRSKQTNKSAPNYSSHCFFANHFHLFFGISIFIIMATKLNELYIPKLVTKKYIKW